MIELRNITLSPMDDYKDAKKSFSNWNATEQIFDQDHALWTLQNPNNETQKVCLFKDKEFMTIYGCLGSFTFDKMIWLNDIHSLKFDNILFQTEKLSLESLAMLTIFDSKICEENLMKWIRHRLASDYVITDEEIEDIHHFIERTPRKHSEMLIAEYCNDKNLNEDIKELITFAVFAYSNAYEDDWNTYLLSNHTKIHQTAYSIEMLHFGKAISPNYYRALWALKVCSEKLLAAANTSAKESSK